MFAKNKLKIWENINRTKKLPSERMVGNMEKSEKLCQVTDKVLELFEEHEVTQHDIEIIMENILANYKHFGILKKGVHKKS